MNFYFSHSYRDIAINTYFLSHFVQENVQLFADQKSDTWCVAKLERYLFEANGIISIIPRRTGENDRAEYSPYIAQELDLARRARLPRLLFVERQVLDQHETRFPVDAIAFESAAPEMNAVQHMSSIRTFLQAASTASRPPLHKVRRRKEVTLVSDDLRVLDHVGNEIVDLLHRKGYSVKRMTLGRRSPALDDVGLLESMWSSSLCVFLLGGAMSQAQIALAMAHAHCIPSIRLKYDKAATDSSPTLHGLIRWSSEQMMVVEFRRQLSSFLKGFVEPVEMAGKSSINQVVRRLGTTEWHANKEQLWDITNGPALIRHVVTDDSFVQDEVQRARSLVNDQAGTERGRAHDLVSSQMLYDGFKRHRYAYELEAQEGSPVYMQKIRSPLLIQQSSSATCIDMACLFAAMLEALGLSPVILVLRTLTSAHALAGYRVAGEPAWSDHNLGVVRRAIQAGDAVFFEATGAIEADSPVTVEEQGERRDKLLPFSDACATATRLLERHDVQLLHLVDVRTFRG